MIFHRWSFVRLRSFFIRTTNSMFTYHMFECIIFVKMQKYLKIFFQHKPQHPTSNWGNFQTWVHNIIWAFLVCSIENFFFKGWTRTYLKVYDWKGYNPQLSHDLYKLYTWIKRNKNKFLMLMTYYDYQVFPSSKNFSFIQIHVLLIDSDKSLYLPFFQDNFFRSGACLSCY